MSLSASRVVGLWRFMVLRALAGARSCAAVAERLGADAVVVRIPVGLDRAEATILGLAKSLGKECLEKVAQQLHEAGGQVSNSLRLLEDYLSERRILVDDLDALRSWAHPELRSVLEPRSAELEQWLVRHSVLQTRLIGDSAEALMPLDKEPPPLSVHNGAARNTAALWEVLGHHPMRFRLAVSRAIIAENEKLLRPEALVDDMTLLGEAWAWLPGKLQRAVELVAVHGRPLPRDIFAELLGASHEAVLQEARRTLILDEEDGSIVVPRPWMVWCDARLAELRQREHHRALAMAFSAAAPSAMSGVKAPYVIEAHRHFLAIPDVARATEYARYGVALLLEHARALSAGQARYAEAASVYDAVLTLDERLRAETGGRSSIDARARGYAPGTTGTTTAPRRILRTCQTRSGATARPRKTGPRMRCSCPAWRSLASSSIRLPRHTKCSSSRTGKSLSIQRRAMS